MSALATAALLSGCGDDANPATSSNGGSGGSGATGATGGTGVGGSGGACLDRCTGDEDCVDCPDERTLCNLVTQQCIKDDLTCPVDEDNEPLVVCTEDADCAACDGVHQRCNTVTQKCVQCVDESHCQGGALCENGKCMPGCPDSCSSHNDCMHCEGPDGDLPACYQHQCAECHPETWLCPTDKVCVNGVCLPPCGIPGSDGECEYDEDCVYCGDPTEDEDVWVCDTPIGGGRGECIPEADSCADLGGASLFPPPYNDNIQLCDEEIDCANADVDFNVGDLIRDLVGSDTIELPFGIDLEICDANASLSMHQCAEISFGGLDCGVCVPCEQDSDCAPIPVDPLVDDLFCNDPLASLAFQLLVGFIWGEENPDHSLHFWCQPVAFGYGACLPCANPTIPCGSSDPGSYDCGDACDHDVCETGDPLDPDDCTDPDQAECAAAVIDNDSWCCEEEWDQLCVDAVADVCTITCGGYECGDACDHDVCTEGDPLDPDDCTDSDEAECAAAVIDNDSWCCEVEWDEYCVDEVADYCSFSCN